MERRFHNPYKHWLSGLAIELTAIAGFAVALALLAVLVVWLAG